MNRFYKFVRAMLVIALRIYVTPMNQIIKHVRAMLVIALRIWATPRRAMTSIAPVIIILCGVVSCTPHSPGVHTQTGTTAAHRDAGEPLTLTILFFNDLHGYLMPFTVKQDDRKVEVGGVARLGGLIRSIEDENEAKGMATRVLVAGDILQGTPMSTEFKGAPDIEILNRIGVDAMTVGNHEFDFGFDNFLKLKSAATFPIISSNIALAGSGELLCTPSVAIDIGRGLTLTVIGVTTQQLMQTTKPSNVKNLQVLDPIEAVRKEYQTAIGLGPVILLSHSEARTDEAIAQALPGLTAIIGGHDQILLNPRKLVGKVPVFQAFEKGRYLGRLDLSIDPKTRRADVAAWTYLPIDATIVGDPAIEEYLAGFQAKLDESFKAVIGTNAVYLDGDRGVIRYEETNLGDWVTDIMREHTGADVALLNSGSLRASIDEGPITVEEVFQAMPYANEMLTVEVPGSVIEAMLRRSVRGTRADEDGGFLHVSGLRFRIRDGVPEAIEVGGKPLNPEATYRLAITDFMAEGGDGYEMLVGLEAYRTGLPLRELIVDTVWMRGTIEMRTDGRIERR